MASEFATDLLESVSHVKPTLTQEDYDRAYKLDAGIKKLAAELEELKARIKEEAVLGTSVHGKVVVKLSKRTDKDTEAMTEALPVAEYPEFYKSVLDVKAVEKNAPDKLVFKPAIGVVSITFAN